MGAKETILEEIRRFPGQAGIYYHMDYPMAHKTGDEEDKAHDVGIVFTPSPFIVCFAYVGPQMQAYEDFIRRSTRALAEENGGTDLPSPSL